MTLKLQVFIANISHVALLALIGLIAAGCTGLASSSGEIKTSEGIFKYHSPSNIGGIQSGPTPRLFSGKCMLSTDFSTQFLGVETVSLLAATGIGVAIDSLGQIIKNSGEKNSFSISASNVFPISSAPSDNWTPFRCMQFVYGEFTSLSQFETKIEDGSLDLAWFAENEDNAKIFTDTILPNLKNNKIYLNNVPDIFLEFYVQWSKDGMYRLVPAHIFYGRTIDNGNPNGKRSLITEVAVNYAPFTASNKNASRTIINFGSIRASSQGINFEPSDDARVPQTLWATAPLKPEEASAWLNIEMRIVETTSGSPILAALGTALIGSAGDEIGKSLVKELFPTPDEENAALTAQVAQIKSFQEQLKAYVTARNSREETLKSIRAQDPKPADLEVRVAREKSVQDSLVRSAYQSLIIAAKLADISLEGIPRPEE